MGVSRFQAEGDGWDRAVQEGARRYRRVHPSATVFHEIRDDWRRTLVPGRRVVQVRTRSAGVRFEPGRPGPPEFWVAAPTREEIVRLGDDGTILPVSDRAGVERRDSGEPPPVDPLGVLDGFDFPRGIGEVSIHAVAFRQSVRVGLPDGTVRLDVREGGWIRVDASHGIQGRRGFAVSEVVLGADPDREIGGTVIAAAERARTRVGAVPVRTHGNEAVFAPGVGGLLIHELIGHALEGDVLAANRSWLRNEGTRAGPVEMTVIDDPRRGRGAWRFDDEGVEAHPTVLVRDGCVAGALLDRASGTALGRASSGHGRRATFRDPVLPRMGATFLDAGGDEEGAAIADTKRGVYILRMSSGRSDPVHGTAVFRVTDADAIDQGRRTHPVQPFVLIVAAAHSPLAIDRIGREIVFDACIGSCHRAGQPLSTSVGAPTFRLGSIRIVPSAVEGT